MFSMAGGIGRSYHARSIGCPNTERRIHYLLEPGWRADQAIQGLGRTHRTHQASAPAVQARRHRREGGAQVHRHHRAERLDSLGAITRGPAGLPDRHGGRRHRAVQGPATTSRASTRSRRCASSTSRSGAAASRAGPSPTSRRPPGSSSPGRATSRRTCRPCRGSSTACWRSPSTSRTSSLGLSRPAIEANIEIAIEAGTFERGVETIVADSLTVASRETVFTHEGSGAETEIVEIARKDRLEPLAADAAIAAPCGRLQQPAAPHRQRPVQARGAGDGRARAHARRRRRAGARAP